MTNRDLIEKLKQFDPDDEVMILGVHVKGSRVEDADFEIIDVENAARGKRVIDLVVYEVS